MSPILRDLQSVEKHNEVRNCKGARWSRERAAAFLAAKTLGRQRLGQPATEPEKRERG
jgi:hypothetical protein